MPKANVHLSDRSFERKFEELPLFWNFQKGTMWRAAYVDGTFEVSYDRTGAWTISDVHLVVDDGTGAAGKTKVLRLDGEADEAFYLLVLEALTQRYAGSIEEWIVDDMADDGIDRIAA